MRRGKGKENLIEGWQRTQIINGVKLRRSIKTSKPFPLVGQLFRYRKEAKLHNKLVASEDEQLTYDENPTTRTPTCLGIGLLKHQPTFSYANTIGIGSHIFVSM